MLLSEWRKGAPHHESMDGTVLAVLEPVMTDLGADADPPSWVLWGEDPEMRYSVLVPTPAGLIVAAVRLGGGSNEGPRVAAKLVRWGKVAVGELSVESSGGHRIVATQVEGQILKGMDDEADRICEFVRGLLAGIDGRAYAPQPQVIVAAAPQPATPRTAAPRPAAARAVPAAAAETPAPAPQRPPAPVAAPAPAPAAAAPGPAPAPAAASARSGLKAIPATVAREPQPRVLAATTPSGNQPRAKKPPKTPGGKLQPAWVAPHPIGLAPREVERPVPGSQPAGRPATASPGRTG